MGKIFIQIIKLEFFYFNPSHIVNGDLSTPMPQECYDYVKALSLEKFLSVASL